jgi:ubiquinone/menaquinone biosynthesis C-methylase UbiE/DNA-binding transcriptional ArsR family regulator
MVMAMSADQAVGVLRAAAEPTRLRILALLAREELAVLELSRILGQSQPRVSRHLKLLAEAGLVERFPDGAWVFYRLTRGVAQRRVADEALALIASDDATSAADASRLEGVAEARAAQAGAYFARNAERWDEIRSLYTSEAAVEAAILNMAGPGPFERLVDLGSGTGRMLTLLGDRARRAVGLDLSRQMLNIARSHVAEAGLGACELRHGNILDTGLVGGEADLVVVHQVLHYLSDPAAAVTEAARLVAPGGALLIVDFAPHALEFLRAEHQHRRLGFSDAEMARWLAAAEMGEVVVETLPPPVDPGAGEGLTVKIWRASRAPTRLRQVA